MTMSDHAAPTPPAQPGLQSLSNSFEPAALEAFWGPEWERRGYGTAGYRGSGQSARARGDRVVMLLLIAEGQPQVPYAVVAVAKIVLK